MKKALSLILVLLILFSMSGCSGTFSLYKSGVYKVYGESYSYKINSYTESETPGNIRLKFGKLEGEYVYEMYAGTEIYSHLAYKIEVEEGDVEVLILKENILLEQPQGVIDLSILENDYLHLVIKSNYGINIKIQLCPY